MTDITARASQWLLGSDTGLSSKAICRWMLLGESADQYDYPSDGGDLGRCLRLLKFIPEWKERMPEMARHGPYWAALVPLWAQLEDALATECGEDFDRWSPSPKTYQLMRSILDSIEKKDKTVIRLGSTTSIRLRK